MYYEYQICQLQGSFPELGLAHVKMFGLAADHQYP